MGWAEICEDPILKDLPYKIQTDKWGNIMMSPATNEHGMYQAKIIALISRLIEAGTIISECSVQTSEGVKVSDVAWASDKFMKKNKGENPFLESPEICIEILSPTNTITEMEEKKALYFDKGANEFWVCDKEGNMKFYLVTAKIKNSNIINDFPDKVVI